MASVSLGELKIICDDIQSSPVTVVLIAGATASGKSDFAVRLAQAVQGAVINFDSMQFYADAHILSARPGPEACDMVPHYLYGTEPAQPPLDAATRLRLIRQAIAEAEQAGLVPVLVGGSGTDAYLLLNGLANLPPVADEVRTQVRAIAFEGGAAALYDLLRQEDQQAAAKLHPSDTQRLSRALEVVRASGQSIIAWQSLSQGLGLAAEKRMINILIDPPREHLRERIDRRFAQMINAGAYEEALSLQRFDPELPIRKIIGVRELLRCAAGEIDLPTAVAEACTATKQYAKRQMTRWRKGFVFNYSLI